MKKHARVRLLTTFAAVTLALLVSFVAPAPVAAANNTTTTISSISPEPSVVGQGYYVAFRIDASPYNGVTVYGTITVDDGEGHTCSRHCLDTDSYCPNYWTAWWWGCTVTSTTAGLKEITATFVPQYTDKYNGSSATAGHQVNQANTKTTLTSTPNPSAEGQSVTFTATVVSVSPGSGTPTGSVAFYADGELLGTGTLNSSGVATFSTSTLIPGLHWITAEYLGDANYNGSESAALAQRVQDADLKILKLVEPDGEIPAGGTVVYTVLVDNLGPASASTLALKDTMTANGAYTVQSIAPSSGSCTPATPASSSGTNNLVDISCTLSSLAAHARWTIIVTAKADVKIDINNVASVYAGTPSDPNTENNYVDGAIAVTDTADLQIVKTSDSPTTVNAGSNASWTVVVTNNGPSPAVNVQVADLLPAGLVDGSLTVTTGQGSCTLGTPGDPADPLVCGLGTLTKNQSVTVHITGAVDAAFVLNQPNSGAADSVDNDAWVTSDTFDPANGNNLDTARIQVTASADLSLLKFAVGTPTAGAEIHYEYQIFNAGPSWSGDVTLRDYLPSQVEFLSAFVDREGGTGTCPWRAT